MDAFKKFDKPTLQLLRQEIQQGLDAVKHKYGMAELKLGNISYREFSFTSKVEAKLSNEMSAKASEGTNLLHSQMLGFDRNIVGEIVLAKGMEFIVTSIDLKKPKYPIIAVGPDQRSYKFQRTITFKNTEIKNNY
jgi:hypothetical protein